MLVIPDGLPVVAVVIPAAIVTVVIPEDAVVTVAPDAKLMAVNEVPTELPPDSTSIPETTPDNPAPSP